MRCWAEAHIKITRMTLTIKLDRNWSSFQIANSTPPLSVTGSAIAPSARILDYSQQPLCFQKSLSARHFSSSMYSRRRRDPHAAPKQIRLSSKVSSGSFESVALLIHVAPLTSSTALCMIPSRREATHISHRRALVHLIQRC